jgi:glycosyltransferase 2 family protein
MTLRLSRIFPAVGILIFAYLIISTGPDKIVSAFASADVSYFIPAVALLLLYLSVQAVKWNYLLRKQRIRLRFMYVFRIYMIGAFYGSITPGRIGTLIRVKYVKRKTGKNTGEASISVVVDKLLDVVGLLVLGILGTILLSNYVSSSVIIPVAASLFFMAALAAVLLKKSLSRAALGAFWKFLVPSHLKNDTRDAFNSFYGSMISYSDVIIPTAIALLGWIIAYTSAYMIALSVGVDVPYPYFITIMSIATVVGLIPITVAGWGTREATVVMFFSLFGVGPEQAIVMSILNNLMNYAVIMPIGAICSLKEDGKAHEKR